MRSRSLAVIPILLLSSLALSLLSLPVAGAAETGADLRRRADAFLELVNAGYQALYRVSSEAQWDAATDVGPEHDAAAATAGKAFAAFNGNPALITEARGLLERRAELEPIQARQLERLLLNAAEGPMTNPSLVQARIEAEVKQASKLNGFEFRLDGQPVTTNRIDEILRTSQDVGERRKVWEASKESGPALKPGLVELQQLRNGVARELGHPDYFSLQVAGFQMSADEMVALNRSFMEELRPLYLQLHTWAKHELAKRYGQPVPERIPAHWLPNRWGQEWPGLVAETDLTPVIKDRPAEWVVKTAEAFYTGLGFDPLPETFWTRSDLYPLEAAAKRKKNTHASCWHVDLERDIRSLMSVESNEYWFTTAHHELGHAYYDMSYTRPEVPPLLRTGANPAFHEAMGELISLASTQPSYLESLGLLASGHRPDPVAAMLDDALVTSIPFVFWASGVMTHWEADVYARGLDPGQWNARWWQYVRDFQGIEPPVERGEEHCDAATKTHINDTPCYYYSYAIATVLKFQLHDHIAKRILKRNPRDASYAGNREVGTFLRGIMAQGATQDWRTVLRQATGEDLSTRAMREYFAPLMKWLEKENRGRRIGWE